MNDAYQYHNLYSRGIMIKNTISSIVIVEPFFKEETKQELRKKKIKRIIDELEYDIK